MKDRLFVYAIKITERENYGIIHKRNPAKNSSWNHFVVPVSRDKEKIRKYGDEMSYGKKISPHRKIDFKLIDITPLVEVGIIPKDKILDLDSI